MKIANNWLLVSAREQGQKDNDHISGWWLVGVRFTLGPLFSLLVFLFSFVLLIVVTAWLQLSLTIFFFVLYCVGGWWASYIRWDLLFVSFASLSDCYT